MESGVSDIQPVKDFVLEESGLGNQLSRQGWVSVKRFTDLAPIVVKNGGE